MRKKDWTNRRVWITGASSGIGRSLAEELSRAGAKLAVSGRHHERLKDVKAACSGEVRTLPFDAADREANHIAVQALETDWGGVDTVILNAGICEYIDLPTFDAASVKRVMDVNFMGIVYGIEAALPLLRKGNSPHLVGMSSTVAYTGLPRAEAYGASKAAIRHLLQALRVDVRAEQIDVSIICPGFVQTPLTDRNDFPMPMRISAEASAQRIRKGLERRSHEIRYPTLFALMLRTLAVLPSRLRTAMLVPMSPNRPDKKGRQ